MPCFEAGSKSEMHLTCKTGRRYAASVTPNHICHETFYHKQPRRACAAIYL